MYVKNADGSYTLDADTLGKLVDKAKPGQSGPDPYAGIDIPADPAEMSDADLEKFTLKVGRAYVESRGGKP